MELLNEDWNAGLTIIRLFREKSKDEFNTILKGLFEVERGIGKSFYNNDPAYFIKKLSNLKVIEIINSSIKKEYTWNDIIIERLKLGRGSAIKGQFRGRLLEDFVENIINKIFREYDSRCNFSGKNNTSIAKADFAIPSKENPSVVIEVKAYGATGSKQTDTLGDIEKIITNKRHDTHFLFVTDGITWLDRISDLRKIIQMQNEGNIYRIYTMGMSQELSQDLQQIKKEKSL